MQILSKSNYLVGLQCLKYLWTVFNDKEKLPEIDMNTQHRFEEGHIAGNYAKKCFPEGIGIPTEEFQENVDKTKELLKERKILFEAGVIVDNISCRIDILKPVNEDEWDIIEVKSSTKIKGINIHDVSFQKYCCEKAGLKIRKCFLMHINNEYVRKNEIDPDGLFRIEEITSEVEEVIGGIQERIDSMLKVISLDKCPTSTISKQCGDPYDCPFISKCWDLPEDNIFQLHRFAKKTCFELHGKGIVCIEDLPGDMALNDKQSIQKESHICGQPHINSKKIKEFLETLEYPLYYLDFETMSPVIPIHNGMRPYQRIPFQFSLHVIKDKGAEPEHYSFLAENADDPRQNFLEELKKVLGTQGSIIVYYQSFEKGVLKELAEAFPEYQEWVNSLFVRIIDLYAPFSEFAYYHPKQKGSASIKYVLPAITGKGYDDLEIRDGDTASISFINITLKDVSEEERQKVRDNLEKYCGLDTEGMIWIVDALGELI